MDESLQGKYQALKNYLSSLGSAVVAFSGGVDSGLVAVVAYQVLGNRMLAITLQSPVEPPEGVQAAVEVARQFGFPHRVMPYDDLEKHAFVENTPERCYFCKRERLGLLVDLAKQEGFSAVLEGSNVDDLQDYRPGKRAVHELGVLSPLIETGFTKDEVRALSRELGLPVWNRPSAPCLATRFPYGMRITREGLKRVAKGEAFLKQLGFTAVRVRDYGSMARLEVSPEQVIQLVEQRDQVHTYFRSLGYAHVAVDLLGYRSGSLNEGVVK
ncbi:MULTISPECIES: ATP-dependent sacrificial sulfur transferase LarE [Anaerolinea]|jgi:uncharacterized protein|uniref:ATP-dependent sacrificial sulfur transferase LarE n=1 Tax=Anaerolinea TaxID=233189 RepID=UPI002602005F|nr:ATP-dependent sacrificial sulfur transferase LarE [Anaerolinea thermophila]